MPVAVGIQNEDVVLKGTNTVDTIYLWAQGNVYHGMDGKPTYIQGTIPAPQKPWNIITL